MIYLGFSLLFQLLQTLPPQPLAASPPSHLVRPLVNVCSSCRAPCTPPSGLHWLFPLAQQLQPFQAQKGSISGLYADLFFSTRRTTPKRKGGSISLLWHVCPRRSQWHPQRSEASACYFVKLRFHCPDLLLVAPGELLGRGIELLSVGCEYSILLESDLLSPDGSARGWAHRMALVDWL